MELEKTLLRKVGEAVRKFRMIREGDRVAVAFSGGKDSFTLLQAMILLSKRAPINFTVSAFTIEQGKFLRPIEPIGEWLRSQGVEWTYYRDEPSYDLIEEQPDHGCDMCSRYRRRAVYEVVSGMNANVIAFGHTADDFCESFLRNAMFTGKMSALPPVTHSKDGEFRLIRPLVFVKEEITTAYAAKSGAPIVPCGCSQKTGTVRRGLRDIMAEMEQEHPFIRDNLLGAMGNLQLERLLDPQYLPLDGPVPEKPASELVSIFNEL